MLSKLSWIIPFYSNHKIQIWSTLFFLVFFRRLSDHINTLGDQFARLDHASVADNQSMLSMVTPFMLPYEPGDLNHPHLFVFPMILRVFSFSVLNSWTFYPIFVAVTWAFLWYFLTKIKNISLLGLFCVLLAIFASPLMSHFTLTPNSDILLTVISIILICYINSRKTPNFSYPCMHLH